MKMQTYSNKLQKKFLLIYERYKNNVFLGFFLGIASYIYLIGYKTRLFLYSIRLLKTKDINAVVISIGNLSCGGTGKTPLVIETANYLTKLGYKVAVLSRGYKRINEQKQNTILVSDGEDIISDYQITGDEPLLIAKKTYKSIVLINKNRLQAALAATKLKAEVLILDDGFQYLRLKKDENILLVDASNTNAHLLPKGNLRELQESMNRASVIAITHSKEIPNLTLEKKINQYALNKPVIYMNYKVKQISGINIKRILSIEEARKTNFISFCGIANPTSFLTLLKDYGLNILDNRTFIDHNDYDSSDIDEIIKCASRHKAENAITTEKDAIKIEDLSNTVPLTFWKLEVEPIWNVLNPFEILFTNKNSWKKKI